MTIWRKLHKNCVDMGTNLSRLKESARYLVSKKERKEMLEFCVVSTQAPPVLGLTSCLSLKLIKLILSVEEMQNPGQRQTRKGTQENGGPWGDS